MNFFSILSRQDMHFEIDINFLGNKFFKINSSKIRKAFFTDIYLNVIYINTKKINMCAEINHKYYFCLLKF